MMGDTPSGVVARRMWPSSVASLGRVTHAPADSTLYRAMMRGQLLHPSGAAPGFDGVGSIRHRSQNFFKAVVGGEGERGGRNFLSGAGGLQRRVPSVQTVQKTVEILLVLFLDMVVTPVVVQRQVLGYASAENCGSSTVAVLGLCA